MEEKEKARGRNEARKNGREREIEREEERGIVYKKTLTEV